MNDADQGYALIIGAFFIALILLWFFDRLIRLVLKKDKTSEPKKGPDAE